MHLARQILRFAEEISPQKVYKQSVSKYVDQIMDLVSSILNDVKDLPKDTDPSVAKQFAIARKAAESISNVVSDLDSVFGKTAKSNVMYNLNQLGNEVGKLVKALEQNILNKEEVWAKIPEKLHARIESHYKDLNDALMALSRLEPEKLDFERSKRKGPRDQDVDTSDIDKSLESLGQ
jgi:phosphate uptake regulator